MGQISLSIPQSGLPNSTEDPKVASDLTAIQTVINGNLDQSNLAPGAVLELLVTGTNRKVAFGQTNATGGGASTLNLAFAHGLGSTPVMVLVQQQGGGFPIVTEITTTDATSVNAMAFSAWISGGWVTNGAVTGWTFTNGQTYSFNWIAIA